jgi:hypothetical protein
MKVKFFWKTSIILSLLGTLFLTLLMNLIFNH